MIKVLLLKVQHSPQIYKFLSQEKKINKNIPKTNRSHSRLSKMNIEHRVVFVVGSLLLTIACVQTKLIHGRCEIDLRVFIITNCEMMFKSEGIDMPHVKNVFGVGSLLLLSKLSTVR